MTLDLGQRANYNIPMYRTGCKAGHRRLEFEPGQCFMCGRQDPPTERLTPEQLRAVADKQVLPQGGGLGLLVERVLQTRMKLRALALLENVDIDNEAEFEEWAKCHNERNRTADALLRAYDEHEVRWAMRAAYT